MPHQRHQRFYQQMTRTQYHLGHDLHFPIDRDRHRYLGPGRRRRHRLGRGSARLQGDRAGRRHVGRRPMARGLHGLASRQRGAHRPDRLGGGGRTDRATHRPPATCPLDLRHEHASAVSAWNCSSVSILFSFLMFSTMLLNCSVDIV